MPATEKVSGIRSLSFNLGGTVGEDDVLMSARVVSAGKEGNKVIGRSLAFGEEDSGESITVNAGETLVFPAGSVHFTIHDCDRISELGPHGYKAISNTVWTWVNVSTPQDLPLFRMLFAAARRLDVAYALYVSILDEWREPSDDSFVKRRARWFKALGLAELLCIALYRSYKIMERLQARLPNWTTIPRDFQKLVPALEQLRHAFEHIEERAMGQVNAQGGHDDKAFTIFNQADFVSSGKLRYSNYMLDLKNDLLPALITARQFVFDVAVQSAGADKVTLNEPIKFFE